MYFLISLISKMNDNNSEGKMSFVQFHSVNVTGNRAHLADKNSQSGAMKGHYDKKHFKGICFACGIKTMLCCLRYHFEE